MTIEKTVFGKKSASVFADGKEYAADPDCIIRYGLRPGEEIDDATFAEFLVESERSLCKKYLYAQIERYSKTSKGYADKLREKGFSKSAIKAAILRAEELGYVDDKRFAENYYEKYRTKKGVNRIINELKVKGVNKEILAFLYEEEDDAASVIALAEKFMRKKEKTPEQRVRLLRHLAGKGFSYDAAIKAADCVFDKND